MTPSAMPVVKLHGGTEIPQLGFGVFQIPPERTTEIVTLALLAGYRHIDTAAAYNNEAEVGAAIHASGVPRADIFVTTKCPNDEHGFDQARRACKASLDRLEVDHLDLYLIHWPVPANDRFVEPHDARVRARARRTLSA